MKTKIVVLAGFAVAVSGCAITGALSGNPTDCATAQKQLASARASLTLAQIALSSAEAFGNPPAIALTQTAVNTISADVNAIQTLVTQDCAVTPAGPAPAKMARSFAVPTVTLAQAKALATSDAKLVDALQTRTK